MTSTSTRKVVRVGGARGITLPVDAKHREDHKVHLIYNDEMILILREDQADMLFLNLEDVQKEHLRKTLLDAANKLTEEVSY